MESKLFNCECLIFCARAYRVNRCAFNRSICFCFIQIECEDVISECSVSTCVIYKMLADFRSKSRRCRLGVQVFKGRIFFLRACSFSVFLYKILCCCYKFVFRILRYRNNDFNHVLIISNTWICACIFSNQVAVNTFFRISCITETDCVGTTCRILGAYCLSNACHRCFAYRRNREAELARMDCLCGLCFVSARDVKECFLYLNWCLWYDCIRFRIQVLYRLPAFRKGCLTFHLIAYAYINLIRCIAVCTGCFCFAVNNLCNYLRVLTLNARIRWSFFANQIVFRHRVSRLHILFVSQSQEGQGLS